MLPTLTFAQDSAQTQVSQLSFVKDMPYICHDDVENSNLHNPGCGDSFFWNVVTLKMEAVPLLIDKLDDTTLTEAVVPLFGYLHTVADVAYVALVEIIHGLPTFELLGVPFDQEGCGYCSYWQHVNENIENRMAFKKAVKQWYETNQDRLLWVTSQVFSSCDCGGRHPNSGHYSLK